MRASRRTFLAGALSAAAALLGRVAPVAARRRHKKRPEPDWLFADRFRRFDRSEWGRAWFNQRYGRHWEVRDAKGVYRLPPVLGDPRGYRPNPVLVLDHDVAHIDLRATLSSTNPTARFGLLARAVTYGDYYAAYLHPSGVLRVTRCNPHHETRLAKRPFTMEKNTGYRMRLRVTGSDAVRVRAKVWPASLPEPIEWTIDVRDSSKHKLVGRGQFGVFIEHGLDGRSTTVRVRDVIARSRQEPRASAPTITYALARPLLDDGKSGRVVAKTAVPAMVGFEYGPEPTLTQGVVTVAPRRTRRGSQTVAANLDLSAFPASTTIYWRPTAERGGVQVVGAKASFRKPPAPGLPVRFAFGACSLWKSWPHSSFEQAALKLPDFYLHQGDLGYVDKHALRHAPDTYQDHWIRMLMDPGIAQLLRTSTFTFAQDDHDYGRDSAYRATYRRFTVDAHNEISGKQELPYYSFNYGDVYVFVIDCRRFSTGLGVVESQRSKLGETQKQWLKQSMVDVAERAGLLVVASPMAFGSDRSPQSWRRKYEAEWAELMDFFQGLGAPVLLLSGDQHGHKLHEYPQKNLQVDVPRVVEFVSAGTEPHTKWDDGIDPDIVLRESKKSGFGLVELGPEQSVGGQRVRDLSLTAVKSTDGTPMWNARYTVVRGFGIIPMI